MKKLLLILFISLLCTSCVTSGKSAGFKQAYDVKALNAQMSTMIATIKQHDQEIVKLNEREAAILDDMGVNLDKMEAEYNKKVEKIKRIREVLLAYELIEPTVAEEDRIALKALMYDKIKEIVNEE